jgi:hypothetical protein
MKKKNNITEKKVEEAIEVAENLSKVIMAIFIVIGWCAAIKLILNKN